MEGMHAYPALPKSPSIDRFMIDEMAILEIIQSKVTAVYRRQALKSSTTREARKTEVECPRRLASKKAHPAGKNQLYACPGEVSSCIGSNVSVKGTQDVVMRVNQLDCGFSLQQTPCHC